MYYLCIIITPSKASTHTKGGVMVRRAADEHLLAPHLMASEFEPQNMTPLPIPPTPAAPPRYIHIPTHPSRSPSLRTSLFSFIILQSSLTMLTPARLPLPPAPSTPRNARNEHTVTPPVGQRSPSHHPPPPHSPLVRMLYAPTLHTPVADPAPHPVHFHRRWSSRKGSDDVLAPLSCSNPRTPPCTHTSHAPVHPFPTRLRVGSRPTPESGFGRFPPWDIHKSQNPATSTPHTDTSLARRRIPPQGGTDTITICHKAENATCKTTILNKHNGTPNTHKYPAQNTRTGMRTMWCSPNAKIERYNPKHDALQLAQTTGKWPTKNEEKCTLRYQRNRRYPPRQPIPTKRITAPTIHSEQTPNTASHII